MATYTKETALYDTGAIATDIANAGTTATSYITRVDATNGIRVHDLNESTDFVQVNSSAISMYRGGTAAANEKVRIEDDEIRVGATTTGHAVLDEDGMDVFIGDTSVAHYGDYARIGKEGEANTRISPGEVVISASDNINALRITPDGNTQTITTSLNINKRINAGDSFTQTHPATPESGTVLKYRIFSLVDEQYRTFSITKGTSKAETTVNVSTRFKFKYSATTAKTIITNTGTAQIRLESISYTYTTISPLTEISGVLTLGQYPYIASDTVLVVGNGTDDTAVSNVFEVDNSGNVSSSGGLYPYNTWMSDFVVDDGTEGLWTYRKWNSGLYEAWYKPTGTTSKASYTTSGGFYGYYQDITFPSQKPLNEHYIVLTEWWIDSGFAWGATTLTKTSSGFRTYALANVSGTHNTQVSCYVAGRWK